MCIYSWTLSAEGELYSNPSDCYTQTATPLQGKRCFLQARNALTSQQISSVLSSYVQSMPSGHSQISPDRCCSPGCTCRGSGIACGVCEQKISVLQLVYAHTTRRNAVSAGDTQLSRHTRTCQSKAGTAESKSQEPVTRLPHTYVICRNLVLSLRTVGPIYKIECRDGRH